MGLQRVLGDVKKSLCRCAEYRIGVVTVDPLQLGADVTRQRLYIIMVLASALPDGATDESLQISLDRSQDAIERVFRTHKKRKWDELLFDESHPIVKKWRQDQRSQFMPGLICVSGWSCQAQVSAN